MSREKQDATYRKMPLPTLTRVKRRMGQLRDSEGVSVTHNSELYNFTDTE